MALSYLMWVGIAVHPYIFLVGRLHLTEVCLDSTCTRDEIMLPSNLFTDSAMSEWMNEWMNEFVTEWSDWIDSYTTEFVTVQ